ncbi:XRE family transcriptional regulator [Rhizobium ruizarguesonis]|uniref:helix-turn-helix domain-containing protein n=1 Tax=Rhizobium ruizarguesonis TaxID=2081791 RepID=UPI000462A31D|nr:helix-turn-helix transcriptional regulator [Rhizobium ruizarguesonis]MBY5851619.1 helix-turn-helix transcriptional regulator [Rhizobium leguminosarum]NKK59859.1 helix-turn-helix domain-containing protein [Rhizobium leguminosarum bv. viciae]MBY5873378.1 helix-turn-helix transcriptional regulator [Rhizobium leguminosarum]MBY5892396.1 helix-turn-helix transcriptional regulator [Rhizobium leguminosarum]NEH38263.1 helix-turn-helix domain-containing protein [Rhizobium ruizarguesonis]
MEIRETFARNLRTLRQARKLSQEELAHRAGIDRTYISSLERCVYSPSIEVLDRLAAVLGVEPADLLRKSGKE